MLLTTASEFNKQHSGKRYQELGMLLCLQMTLVFIFKQCCAQVNPPNVACMT